ncbi:MAG: DUF2442 domain-containing protein [bacterium]|nr:DUF2442 domain-containing protein [bacterium]
MSSSAPEKTPRATSVEISGDELIVTLRDGRRIASPLAWYPRLQEATPEARGNWTLLGDGVGIHWPEIDEDLSIEGLLEGRPAIGLAREAR